jgi:hypothetical protein
MSLTLALNQNTTYDICEVRQCFYNVCQCTFLDETSDEKLYGKNCPGKYCSRKNCPQKDCSGMNCLQEELTHWLEERLFHETVFACSSACADPYL